MRIKMAIVSLVSTAIFLALAVWPYGNIAQFLANPARLALVLLTAVALAVAFFQPNFRSGRRRAGG